MAIHWLTAADSRQAQSSIQPILIPLQSIRETSSFNVGNLASAGTTTTSESGPTLSAIDGATDGAQRLRWPSSNNDQVTFEVPLPGNLDTSKDITVHCRTVSGGTTNAVGFTMDAFFDEAGTKVTDTTGTNQTTTYAEVTATIAAADIPSGARTVTIGLTPVAHTNDTLSLTAVWLEYTAKSPEVEIDGTDLYCCRIRVPYTHKLIEAHFFCQNLVITGTLTVTLRRADRGDSRGGTIVGTALNNTTILGNQTSVTDINHRVQFTLTDDDIGISSAFRNYFLILTGTDPADRIEETELLIKVEEIE